MIILIKPKIILKNSMFLLYPKKHLLLFITNKIKEELKIFINIKSINNNFYFLYINKIPRELIEKNLSRLLKNALHNQ